MTHDSDNLISCDTHGDREPAYICKHLQNHPAQEWFSELQSRGNLFPDAWCKACEFTFQKNQGWNDASGEKPEIVAVCDSCYQSLRAQSVAHWDENIPEQWEGFIRSCSEKLQAKQDFLRENFNINEHKRWDWDLEKEVLEFSNDGIVAVTAKMEFVGSVSTSSNTWLWGWANPSLEGSIDTISNKLTTFGRESKYLKLTTPFWSADEIDGWEMTAVAAELLGSRGAYRTTSESSYTYMLIHDINWVS